MPNWTKGRGALDDIAVIPYDPTETPFARIIKQLCYAIFKNRVDKINALHESKMKARDFIYTLVMGLITFSGFCALVYYHYMEDLENTRLCNIFSLAFFSCLLVFEMVLCLFRTYACRHVGYYSDFVLQPANAKKIVGVLREPVSIPSFAAFSAMFNLGIKRAYIHWAREVREVDEHVEMTVGELSACVHAIFISTVIAWSHIYLIDNL
jgi:hypothetical protein